MADGPIHNARVVVFAYHDVGYECLGLLIARGINVVAVFSHEDSATEQIWFRSVVALAREHDLPVYTPKSVNEPEWIGRIRAMQPDLIFSFYYREMIADEILGLAPLGAYNMHGSLLPKYRGRAPVNWAVLHGETETGATLHVMVRRPDAGDIVDQEAVGIGPEETAREVFDKVTLAARTVLERQLDNLIAGRAPRRPQDESAAQYFGGRNAEDGRIDWSRDGRSIFNLIRAVTRPYPGAHTQSGAMRLTIWWAKPVLCDSATPGEVISVAPLKIGTGDGCLEVSDWEWQAAGLPSHATDNGPRVGMRFDPYVTTRKI